VLGDRQEPGLAVTIRRGLRWTLLLLLLGLPTALPGCLEDLPGPTECPPPAQFAGTDCLPALQNPPTGCFDVEQMACLAGPRSSCTCIADECPAQDDACYPDGDCPQAVSDLDESVECHRLEPERLGGGLPSETICLCGCAGCAAVCDGKGPVMGVVTDEEHIPALIVDLTGMMPDSGRLGVYLRVRGLASFVMITAIGDASDLNTLQLVPPVYSVVTPLGLDFTEGVLFDDEFLGVDAYRWDRPEDKPSLIALAPREVSGTVVALAEFDCIVPFVVPL